MEFDAATITASAAVIAALVAIIAVAIQIRVFRATISTDVILKLQSEFDSERMRRVRASAAKSLKEPNGTEGSTDLDEVLNFFDALSLLVYRGVLDRELVWHYFYHWVHHYWDAASSYINSVRDKSPEIWSDIERLHRQLLSVENERCKRPYNDPDMISQEKRDEFLDIEIGLGGAGGIDGKSG
jgi:hypothetical protein